jgi:hypothetical protein
MKKYLLGLFAIVLAIGFSAFTAKKSTFSLPEEYKYFEFMGTHGDEAIEALWQEISEQRYLGELECDFNEEGCKIVAKFNPAIPSRPLEVTVNPSTTLPIVDPNATAYVIEVFNRPE